MPDLGIAGLRAKIDTGARTSSLHATSIQCYDVDGVPWVRFHVPLGGGRAPIRCAAPLVDQRLIKNTSGQSEARFIIRTTLVLAARHWQVEVSLANRENMGFAIILGRTALRRRRVLINPGRSFLAGPPVMAGIVPGASREPGQTAIATSGHSGQTPILTKGNRQ